ncbi:MAG: DUF2303 family protein [Myxococcota bacterium]
MNTTDDYEDEITTRTAEAQAVINFAKANLGVEQITAKPDARAAQLLLVPKGRKILDLHDFFEKARPSPERRKGTAVLATLESLIAHANRFKDEDSALFASPDPGRPRIVAVLDYHRQNAAGAPRFGDHRGEYNFPLSVPWLEWTANDGEFMPMADFAAFLEKNIEDVADPAAAADTAQELADKLEVKLSSPSALLSAAKGLTVKVEQVVRNARNLSTGEVELVFEERHSDGAGAGKVNVPQAFLLGIPVFRGGDFFSLAARLRYRLHGGVVTFAYNLHRADRLFDHAFTEACERAAKETSLPLFMGAPEK